MSGQQDQRLTLRDAEIETLQSALAVAENQIRALEAEDPRDERIRELEGDLSEGMAAYNESLADQSVRLDGYLEERDEARAEAAEWKQHAEADTASMDEARAEVERLKDDSAALDVSIVLRDELRASMAAAEEALLAVQAHLAPAAWPWHDAHAPALAAAKARREEK